MTQKGEIVEYSQEKIDLLVRALFDIVGPSSTDFKGRSHLLGGMVGDPIPPGPAERQVPELVEISEAPNYADALEMALGFYSADVVTQAVGVQRLESVNAWLEAERGAGESANSQWADPLHYEQQELPKQLALEAAIEKGVRQGWELIAQDDKEVLFRDQLGGDHFYEIDAKVFNSDGSAIWGRWRDEGELTPPPPQPDDSGDPGFIGVDPQRTWSEEAQAWVESPFQVSETASARRIAEAERTLAQLGQFVEPELFERESAFLGQEGRLQPTYRPGDQDDMFYGMDPAWLADVKAALLEAGVIGEGEAATPGWSIGSADGMSVVMDRANHLGVTWQEAAGIMAHQFSVATNLLDSQGVSGGRGTATQPRMVYKAPDYDMLKGEVRSLFQSALGRQPKDYELALLADQLDADYRAQFDADFAAQELLTNTDGTSAEGGRVPSKIEELTAALPENQGTAPPSDTGDGAVSLQNVGTVRTVDPLARMAEKFRATYGQEMQNLERKAEQRFSFGNFMNSISGTAAQVRR